MREACEARAEQGAKRASPNDHEGSFLKWHMK